MAKKRSKHIEDEELDNIEKDFNEEDFNDEEFDENFDDDVYEDEYGDEDFDDDFESNQRTPKPDAEKKKEYYVKGADLIAELKKYQESKKNSPDR